MLIQKAVSSHVLHASEHPQMSCMLPCVSSLAQCKTNLQTAKWLQSRLYNRDVVTSGQRSSLQSACDVFSKRLPLCMSKVHSNVDH